MAFKYSRKRIMEMAKQKPGEVYGGGGGGTSSKTTPKESPAQAYVRLLRTKGSQEAQKYVRELEKGVAQKGTYNPTTGVYTSAAGQGFSMAEAPAGATIISGTRTTVGGAGARVEGGRQLGKSWGDIGAALEASFNPFSKNRIEITTGSEIYNTAAELIVNNPYIFTAMLTGAGALANFVTGAGTAATAGWTVGGATGTVGTTAKVAANTVTAKASASMIAKIAVQMKKPAYVVAAVGAMIGTYPWSEWALGEAKEGMVFNAAKAMKTGDPSVIAEFQKASDEIFDITLWENIQRLIPGANIAYSFGQKAKALAAQRKVNDRILADEITKIETGETDDEKWERVNAERQAQFEASEKAESERFRADTDYMHEAAAAAKKAERAEDKKFYEEQARFWAGERDKEREKAAADRQAIAEFWIAYRKTMQQIADNNRPSNLNFGLL